MGRAAGHRGSGDEEARGGCASRERTDATGPCSREGQGETTRDGPGIPAGEGRGIATFGGAGQSKGVGARYADEDPDGEGNGPERTRDAVGAARTGFGSQRGWTSSRAGGSRFPKERAGGGRARASRGIPTNRGCSEGARTGPSDREEPREAGRSRPEETGRAPRGDHGARTGCAGDGGGDGG